MMTYVKIHDMMLDSSIMEHDIGVRWAWVVILALTDRDGVLATTPAALARRANMPLADLEAAMAVLLAPDPSSSSAKAGGRRIVETSQNRYLVVNYEHYRELLSKEDQREKTRLRVARHRARKQEEAAGNAAVTPCAAGNDIAEAEAEAEAEEHTLHVGVGWCMDVWNETATACGLSAIKVMSDNRVRVARRRVAQHGEVEVRRALNAPRTSQFLRGAAGGDGDSGRSPWRASFDWIMKIDNMTKVLEDNYLDAPAQVPPHMRVGEAPSTYPWNEADVRQYGNPEFEHPRWNDYYDECTGKFTHDETWPRFEAWLGQAP